MNEQNSSQHIVKTSEQWNDRAVEYYVIPRGCLCVELTPKKKTRIKIGEGDKCYSLLPYIDDYETILLDYYTKEEVDNIINTLDYIRIKSTKVYNSKEELPTSHNKLGDMYFVKVEGSGIPTEYIWNNTEWIPIGGDWSSIDISQFVKRDEIIPRVETLESVSHSHLNKQILDQISAAFTVPDKLKLDSLENYDDTEIRNLIKETGHTHSNKDILDKITAAFTEADKLKLDSLENYDDSRVWYKFESVDNDINDLKNKSHTHDNKSVLDQVTQSVIDYSHYHDNISVLDQITQQTLSDIHTHSNKRILDNITAPFTQEDLDYLYGLKQYDDFIGATSESDGTNGLVPAPTSADRRKFLRGDGTWVTVQGGGGSAYGPGIGIEFVEPPDDYPDDVDYIINNTGVIDIKNKPDAAMVLTITTGSTDIDLDLLENVGKLTFNCNNSPE